MATGYQSVSLCLLLSLCLSVYVSVCLSVCACQMSKTSIGGTVCREFESEVPAAEEMLDHVVCSREQLSFQMCLESGDGSGTFCD